MNINRIFESSGKPDNEDGSIQLSTTYKKDSGITFDRIGETYPIDSTLIVLFGIPIILLKEGDAKIDTEVMSKMIMRTYGLSPEELGRLTMADYALLMNKIMDSF